MRMEEHEMSTLTTDEQTVKLMKLLMKMGFRRRR